MPLAAPIYLRLTTPPFDGAYLCIREHQPRRLPARTDGPLVLVTYHPGFIAGSYGEWDYFERLSPLLFAAAGQAFRLRVFTVNHPGYDVPASAAIDRYRLEAYSIRHQPQAMRVGLRWLLDGPLTRETDIIWIAYGHSMGGLALSQCQTEALAEEMAAAGRRLRPTRVLSAPAFCIQPEAQAILSRLDVLHTMKLTLGRLPLYAPVATGLFRAFAPLFYLAGADRFTIGGLRGFGGYGRLNPFILLEQGRELLRLAPGDVCGPDTLADAHILLSRQDGMVNWQATHDLIAAARGAGYRVNHYDLDSTHLLEVDRPDAVAGILRQIIAAALEEGHAADADAGKH